MRRGAASLFALISAVIFVITLASSLSPASAADIEPNMTEPGDASPVLAGIQATQVGGSELLVRVRGHKMPIPTAETGPGEMLVLRWDGVRFPQSTDKRDWWDSYEWDVLTLGNTGVNTWWKQYDYPLLERVSAEPIFDQVEEEATDPDTGDKKTVLSKKVVGMRLTFAGPKPLIVKQIDGMEGADATVIMLKVWEPEPAPKPAPLPKMPEKGDPMTINTPVTLSIRDGDVKSVFRMLAEQQKINLLLDPSVPDTTVTFSFKNIPFHEAFAYLLRMTDLSYSMNNGTLIVGRVESLGKTLGREIVRAYKISYAIEEDGNMRGDLVAALTGLVKLSTAPTLDQRNRTLYVTATEEQHSEVEALLMKLDQPGKQIMLQARIIEVTDDGRQELETLVSAVYNQWLMNFSSNGVSIGYNSMNDVGSNNEYYNDNDYDLDIPIAGRPVGNDETFESIVLDNGFRMLSAGLRALETKGKGKVLANPSVITIDGEESRVELTTNLKYPSGVDANGNTSYSDVQTGPKLYFTPVIGRNGVITIKIEIETGEITGWRSTGNGAQTPQTSSRRVNTIVRVRNAEPFAVGGLYQESKTKERNRIPVLGYIPLLGDLFTFRRDQHIKSEVAMVVIPYILDVPDENISTYDLMKRSLSQ